MKKLYIDVETRSRVDLNAAGSRRYAVDPSTMVTTAAWKWAAPKGAFSPVMTACNIPSLAGMGRASMAEFTKALGEADTIVAHHINFDVNVITATMGPCGMKLKKFDCTMARAQRMSLPGGLDELCSALGVQGKTAAGHVRHGDLQAQEGRILERRSGRVHASCSTTMRRTSTASRASTGSCLRCRPMSWKSGAGRGGRTPAACRSIWSYATSRQDGRDRARDRRRAIRDHQTARRPRSPSGRGS